MSHITALAPYPIFPAKMGGQKGIALFYEAFAKKTKLTLVSTWNNSIPRNMDGEFLPMLPSSRFRYINVFYFGNLKKCSIREVALI